MVCYNLNDDVINTYQDLVREDINQILNNACLSSGILGKYDKKYIGILEKNDLLECRDGCCRTAHGRLVEALYNIKFLPFKEYQKVAEINILNDVDGLPGIKKPILDFDISIDDLLSELEKFKGKGKSEPEKNCKSEIIEAAKVVLESFKKTKIRKVSNYQADYIINYVKNRCNGKNVNVVIDSPTGSGKTLIFTFMALLEALLGRRAIIIYPRKSLAEDQSNRLIKHIYELRKYYEYEYRWKSIFQFTLPTLLIVDGDHAESGSESGALSGLIGKTLKCPEDGTDLAYGERGIYCGRGHSLDFLYVFKSDLSRKPSIIVTNRFIILTRLLHKNRSKYDLTHLLERLGIVVIDEAHVYSNLEGGDMARLMRLLRDLSKDINGYLPNFVVSSATIPKPLDFSKDLVGDADTIYFEYDKYRTTKYRLIIPIIMLPTPRFSLETLAQLVVLISLLWAEKYSGSALMFVDSRQEVGRLYHYLKEVILTRGGFDRMPKPGDVVWYHTETGIGELVEKTGIYKNFTKDDKALWDGILCNEYRNSFDKCVKSWRDKIEMYYAWLDAQTKSKIFNDLKDGKLYVLLATSTLELGIDIEDVSIVIQYKLPIRGEGFVQRVGRAGRSNNSCRTAVAILLLSQSPTSSAYMYDEALQRRLVDLSQMPRLPINLHNERLELRYQLFRALLESKKQGGTTHYPRWG